MPITATELNQRALLFLGAGERDSVWREQEVEANQAIILSLHQLGRTIAEDESRFGQLQQDYTVTPDANGVANVATAVGALTGEADIIWESIRNGRVRTWDGTFIGNDLKYIPDTHDFEAYVLPGWQYYTLRGSRIYVRDSQGDYNTDKSNIVGDLLITANYTPSIGNIEQLPDDLIPEIIRIHAAMLATKFESKLINKPV